MSTLETKKVPTDAQSLTTRNGPSPETPPKRRKSAIGKFLLLLLLGGAAVGAYDAYMVGPDRVRRDVDRTISYVRQHGPEPTEATAAPQPTQTQPRPRPAWDGLVRVRRDEAETLGLVVVAVQSQVNPIKL